MAFFCVQLHSSATDCMRECDFEKIIYLLDNNNLSPEQRDAIERSLNRCVDANTPKKKRGRDDEIEPEILETPALPKKARAVTDIGTHGWKLFLSPAKEEGDLFTKDQREFFVVYAHMLVKSEALVPREDRIWFPDLLDGEKITGKNLDQALLKIENTITQWIYNDEEVYRYTIYVGMAKRLAPRAYAHGSSLRNLQKEIAKRKKVKTINGRKKFATVKPIIEADEDEYMLIGSNKKARFSIQAAEAAGRHIRMSPLVFNVPEKWLPLVEILVGSIFNSTQKSGTFLGNKKSADRFFKYWNSKTRTEGLLRKEYVTRAHKRDIESAIGIRRK